MVERIIYTIGHSNRSLRELLKILKYYKIDVVVDVRRWPSSKKFPHFSREFLEKELQNSSIKYVWLGDLLGGYRTGGYEKYMKTNDFKKGITKLEKIVKDNTVVIMCSEKLWFKCHRRFIANELVKRGYKILHIIEIDRLQIHKLRET
ncbi:MAG: hypothetical protein B6U94_04495 [Thermofilum sp. ex4484_79]|nr:MAG: hypothetical protein B6U94_04495 [Thermofilum sp. ex4484_79]